MEKETKVEIRSGPPPLDESQNKYLRTLRLNYLRYLRAAAPELIQSYHQTNLSERGNFLDKDTGEEMKDKSPTALIQDPKTHKLIERATRLELGMKE